MTALALALTLLLPALDAAPEPTPVRGYASAYAPGVMEATVSYRLEHDLWRTPPPPAGKRGIYANALRRWR